jgi:hypothetical protein
VSTAELPYHHGSHQNLLWAPTEARSAAAEMAGATMPDAESATARAPEASIDAIIVPTARRPAYLADAAALAKALNCTLVTLHSNRWTSAEAAAASIPRDVDLIAIDVPEATRLRLPRWETSEMLAGTIFERRMDLSAKRNLGLLLSHMLDWSRIAFLDDDITELNPDDFRQASTLLNVYNAVGFEIGRFPDNSVVCHAYRGAGGPQLQFVGGGALTVNLDRCISYFPDIYNDDWFFLLDGDKWLQPTAIVGQVAQYPYDPYRVERARAEELGDVLAEGIYWLLDQDRSIMDADRDHWAKFLDKRRQFIVGVMTMISADKTIDHVEKERRITALKSSLGRLARITPALCEDYLHAWANDRRAWHRHLELSQRHLLPGAALAALSQRGTPRLSWRIHA